MHAIAIYPSQRRILLHDLENTYTHLNNHIAQQNPEHTTIIVQRLREEKLFLNVDNPDNDSWRFEKGDALVFDKHDEDGIQYVREFLLPYEELLTAIEVSQVYRPQYSYLACLAM